MGQDCDHINPLDDTMSTPSTKPNLWHGIAPHFSVPSLFVRSTLTQVLPALSKDAILLNVAKGFAPGTRQLLPFLLERAGGVPAPLARWVRRVLAGTPPSLDGFLRALRAATQTIPE